MLTFEEHLRELVVAIDAQIDALERKLTDLRQYRRLTLDIGRLSSDARERLASRAAPTKTAENDPRSALKVEDVLDAARDLLAEGPTTVANVFRAIGKSPAGRSPKQKATIEAALQQLGAVRTGNKGHSGAMVWALPAAKSEPDPEPEPEPERDLDAEIEQSYQERHKPDPPPAPAAGPSEEDLVAAVLELTANAVGWSDGELRYQLKRRGIDVEMSEVRKAREVATQRRMKARMGAGRA